MLCMYVQSKIIPNNQINQWSTDLAVTNRRSIAYRPSRVGRHSNNAREKDEISLKKRACPPKTRVLVDPDSRGTLGFSSIPVDIIPSLVSHLNDVVEVEEREKILSPYEIVVFLKCQVSSVLSVMKIVRN